MTKQIQNTLGDFQKVNGMFLDEPKRHMWPDGHRGMFPLPLSAGRPQPPPEFKKPHQSNGRPPSSSSSSSHHRNLVKPNDGKPTQQPPSSQSYDNRSYQNQSTNKHGNNMNNHRINGMLSSKGPPPQQSSTSPLPSNSSSRLQATARNLPRIPLYIQVI